MKISKRLLSMLAAGVMFATPVAGLAEEGELEETIDNQEEFMLYSQDELFDPVDPEEFEDRVEFAEKYLKSKNINFDRKDLQCLMYLIYRESMLDEDAKILEGSVVHGSNIANGEFQNFEDAYRLIDEINNHNQAGLFRLNYLIHLERMNFNNYNKEIFNKYLTKVIKNKKYSFLTAIEEYNREVGYDNADLIIDGYDMCLPEEYDVIKPYLEKVVNEGYDLEEALKEYDADIVTAVLEDRIDLSELFTEMDDQKDREFIHSVNINGVFSFLSITNGVPLTENENYKILFSQLTTLNDREYKEYGNVESLTAGWRFAVENVYGVEAINTQYEYLKEVCDRANVNKAFSSKDFDAHELVVLTPLNVFNPTTEEEIIAGQYKDLHDVAAEFVNNDLITLFAKKCMGNTK